jgi:diaminopimelate decarboxylase
MLRLALSVGAETHPYLLTSGADTKFGLAPEESRAALSFLAGSASLSLVGLHAHPGSQISDARVYEAVLRCLLETVDTAKAHGLAVEEVSIGGGWAVPYRPEDAELTPEALATALGDSSPDTIRLAVEPGRFLVARAGVAMYRVRSVKERPAGRLVAVDGGMGDNPRPAIYGARYLAMPVRDSELAGPGRDRLVGRYCEEGDVFVKGANVPVAANDLVVVPVSGGYQLSMASTYNLVPQPAVVLVSEGQARLAVRRATRADLLARELEVLDEN